MSNILPFGSQPYIHSNYLIVNSIKSILKLNE